MAEPLPSALAQVRAQLLKPDLVRGIASGKQRGASQELRRVELRPVDLKGGRHIQVVSFDATQAITNNHRHGPALETAIDALLAKPFGNWHVETTESTLQLRVTKKGEAVVSLGPGVTGADTAHDRAKDRLLPADDPVLIELGISDAQGRVKPSRQAKYRQVEEFLRALDAAFDPTRAPRDRPLRVVDLGCGNAYLTFAAHRFLAHREGLEIEVIGVDRKQQSLDHNTTVATRLGIGDSVRFLRGDIDAQILDVPVDITLALHACDTATDDALAAAVAWESALVLAAPCCHHDIARQLRRSPTPPPYGLLARDGILRERFADTLTDALRAALLRLVGYRVDVMEFIESQHTPRNTLLRAVRTGSPAPDEAEAELETLMQSWQVRPRLAALLAEQT